jgi:hypothetical protein
VAAAFRSNVVAYKRAWNDSGFSCGAQGCE